MDLHAQHPGEHMLLKANLGRVRVDLSAEQDRTIRADFLEQVLTAGSHAAVRSLHLADAEISGELVLSGATLGFPLRFRRCTFAGRPDLSDATMMSLAFDDCSMPGVMAGGLVLRGTFAATRLTSTEEMDFTRSQIGGAMLLTDCRFSSSSEKKWAFSGGKMQVVSTFRMVRCTAEGAVRLIGASVGGVANLRSSTFSNPGDTCVQAERIEVDESIWFNNEAGSSSSMLEGRVILDNARIGGSVNFSGAIMSDPSLKALDPELAGWPVSLQAVGARVGANFLCRDGFEAAGVIALTSLRADGLVSFDKATLSPASDKNGNGVCMVRLDDVAARTMRLTFAQPPQCLELTNATVDLIADEESSWSPVIMLDGLSYQRLASTKSIPVKRRLDWLSRGNAGYVPQPYEQLITAYQRAGQENEARRVGFAKQVARTKTLRRAARIWPYILLVTVGYGYRTWIAGLWLTALIVIGSIAFARSVPVPANEHSPPFQPIVYSFDVLVPILDLGQQAAWQMSGPFRWMAWGYTIGGWVLTTAVAAGITRILKRT